MFQGNVLSKVFKVRSKIFAICKCFFLQTHWLLQRTSTNTATSDNIAKYISKPKSQARIHLSSQYWNTQGMRIRTHHHGQRVWTDPIFCTIRNCNWGHWLPHSWAVHSWQDGQGGHFEPKAITSPPQGPLMLKGTSQWARFQLSARGGIVHEVPKP